VRDVAGTKNNDNDELVNQNTFLKQNSVTGRPLLNNVSSGHISKADLNLPKVRGLANLGNTCFFNSVLQCLAQTSGLVELLREMDVPGEKFHLELDGKTIDAVLEKQKSSVLSDQLAQVLTEVSGLSTTGDGRTGQYTVNPRHLLAALTSKCRQFEGGDQHDAHELLRHLLDSVHMEDLRRYQKAILDHIGYQKPMNLDELEEDKKKFGKRLNQQVCDTIPIRPDQIFKGSLVSVLQCTVCDHKSRREEPFLDLSLPVVQEKAHPVHHVRRKQSCSSPVEEDIDMSTKQVKLQLLEKETNKRKKLHRLYKNQPSGYAYKKEQNSGEPTIEEESKKDSTNGEQSDADVEDNEDNICEEQDHKTEIVESGYSSEKQMSARGSPVTTQSPEEESKPGLSAADMDPALLLANRAESGLGSIQELTVTIPEEANTECTSQDSVQVNASNGSPDISSDSQLGNLKVVEFCSSNFLEKLPSNLDHQMDRAAMVNDWNCLGGPNSNSQDSSLSHSPQCSQDNINVSSKTSPKGSPESGNENGIHNVSPYNSLPENGPPIMNSPKSPNSHREEMSGDERPESRLDCHKNRSSPVEPGNPSTELDSGLLKLSLEGMTKAAEIVYVSVDSESEESLPKPCQPVYNAEDGFTLVGGITKNAVPSPPPLPAYTVVAPAQPSLPVPKYNKYKIEEGECSLQSCLNQFTTIEMLAGGNKVGCDACTERINKGNKDGKTVYQNSTKQLLISKPPPIMIFHLKRFQAQKFSCRKLTRHVEFPLILDISPFCEDKNCEPMLYSLYGVVEHSGTLHGGHYVAYVKVRSHTGRRPAESPLGKWYYISDSRVCDIEESKVLKSQAYLLFYERIL